MAKESSNVYLRCNFARERQRISNSHLCCILRFFFIKPIWSSTRLFLDFFFASITLGGEIIMSALTSTPDDFQSSRICQKGNLYCSWLSTFALAIFPPSLVWRDVSVTPLAAVLSQPGQAMPWNGCLSSCQHDCSLTAACCPLMGHCRGCAALTSAPSCSSTSVNKGKQNERWGKVTYSLYFLFCLWSLQNIKK